MGIFKKKETDVPNRRRNSGLDSVNADSSSRSDVFRRGRTIVGKITSINDESATGGLNPGRDSLQVNSSRTHVHHLSIKRRKLSGLLIIALLNVVLLWILVNNFTATVIIGTSNLDITRPINESKYSKTINAFLDTNPLARISVLLDSTLLNDYVIAEHPEVQDISRQGNTLKPGETDFVMTFRKPVAGWKMKEKQYYVDSKGVSFEVNYFSEPTVQIVDSSGISPQSGVAIASKRFLGFVGRVVSLSRANGFEVTQAVLPKNTTRELDIYFKGRESYVKLNVDRGVGEQIEDMVNAFKYFTTKNQTPKYIDVRVSNKAFYRF